jgi:gliding motility-associated-like protein
MSLKVNLQKVLLIAFSLINLGAFAQEGFIKNEGQWDGDFTFKAHIKGGVIFAEDKGITWLFYDADSLNKIQHYHWENTSLPIHVIKSTFMNANKPSAIETGGSSTAMYNYYLGNDSQKWKTRLQAYNQLTYRDIYPQIDLEILYNAMGIKYNFIVKPGGNPDVIKIAYEGADQITLKNLGLQIKTSLGQMQEYPPLVYQEINGEKQKIQAGFELNSNELSFKISGKYKRKHTLVIDPILIFSTYSGSVADNFGFTATYDSSGNGYAAGTVYGFNFPTTPGAYDLTYNGGVNETTIGGFGYNARDCAIHKYSKDGKELLYGTFIGGNHNEQPHSMIVNSRDELIVFGSTRSKDFPANHLFLNNPNPNKKDYNIFVSIFSTNGDSLLSSALIGGSDNDGINGDLTTGGITSWPLLNNYADDFRGEVIVDENDNVYIASSTNSNDFPIVNGVKEMGAPQNGVTLKLNSDLSSILWSTEIGRVGFDAAYGIALGNNNDVFVAGGTTSGMAYPSIPGHRNVKVGNDPDGFLVKFDKNTGQALSATLIGTDQYDQAYMVKTDVHGYPLVFGQTRGNFPRTPGIYANAGASQFIAKYHPNLETQEWSTTVGSGRSTPDISPTAFLVDICGNIYVSGWGGNTNSTRGFTNGTTFNMPITPISLQKQTDGSDFWLAVFAEDMEWLRFSTYFGGLSSGSGFGFAHEHVDGGTSRFDKRGVIYQALCAGCGSNSLFPTTEGAWSRTNNSPNCNFALFKIDMDVRNRPPAILDTFFTIRAFDTLSFRYKGTDLDRKDTLTLSFLGDILNYTDPEHAMQIYSTPARDSVFADIYWIPNCEHLTNDTIVVKVKIEDTGCPDSDSSFATLKFLVTAPPFALGPKYICIEFEENGRAKISWDPFETGYFFKRAFVYREDPDGATHLKATMLNGNGGSFLEDIGLDLRNNNYCYYIVTENICGMLDTMPFKICSKDEYENPIFGVHFLTATVPDNQNVNTIWTKSIDEDFRSYRVFRAKNQDGFMQWERVAEIFDINDTSYLDSKVDVAKESYCYFTQVTDLCGHISDTSNFGCNIVLEGVSKRWFFDLDWAPYREWESGVYEYVVKRSVDTGALRPIVAVNYNKQNYRDEDLDYDWGGYYFQIEAHQMPDSKRPYVSTSTSNTIYMIQPPLLHVPNAFSPNGDGLNDVWGFVPVFVREFNMRVFNRWGEKVFDSDNKKLQWEGKYLSAEPYDNVFIWICTYKGWDNEFYKQKGTVTIVR